MDQDKLSDLWFRSYEEDAGDRIVYRRRNYDFPRSRRPREAMTLKPDGTASMGTPGPADALETAPATWKLSGDDELYLTAAGTSQTYQIVTSDDEKLVLRQAREEEEEDGQEQ